MTEWRPPLALISAWLALLLLLALTVTLAYLPLGAFNAVVALMIAATKAAIVAAIFCSGWDRWIFSREHDRLDPPETS